MKKKITDWLDEMPEEFIDELMENQTAREQKKIVRFPSKKSILLIAALIGLMAGVIGFAAVYYPDLFRIYFTDDNDTNLKDQMVLDKNQSVENKDYRIRVENIMSDARFKSILISVEALNKKSQAAMEKGDTAPIVVMEGADANNAEEWVSSREKHKRYYLSESDFTKETTKPVKARIFYIEGISGNWQFMDWMYEQVNKKLDYSENESLTQKEQEEKEKEFMKMWNTIIDSIEPQLTISIDSGTGKSKTLKPTKNKFEEGLSISDISIYPSGIIYNGTISAELYQKMGTASSYESIDPLIIVTMKDKTKYCILKPDGYELPEGTLNRAAGRRARTNSHEEDGKTHSFQRNISFTYMLDIDEIETIEVNGVSY